MGLSLFDIINNNWHLFGVSNSESQEIVRYWVTDTIRDSRNRLLDLQHGRRTHHVDITVKRFGRSLRRNRSFLEYNGHLIPLGTHTSNKKSQYSIYKINGTIENLTPKPINMYLLENFKDEIILTRVLSEEEVIKWGESSSDLGSSHDLFWHDSVHTSYFNTTDEFVNDPNYKRLVRFVLTKDELKTAFEKEYVELGTYNYVFRDRDPNSTFPIDFELIFKGDEGISLLRNAYQRWREKERVNSLPNPFADY